MAGYNPYKPPGEAQSPRRLLEDDERLRADLLDMPEAPAWGVGEMPQLPEPMAPAPTAPVAPAMPPDPSKLTEADDLGEAPPDLDFDPGAQSPAPMVQADPADTEPAPQAPMGESKWDRASQAIYSAHSGQPLPGDFFSRRGDSALKKYQIDSVLAAKNKEKTPDQLNEADTVAQDAFMRAFPEMLPEELVRRMSANQLNKYLPVGGKKASLAATQGRSDRSHDLALVKEERAQKAFQQSVMHQDRSYLMAEKRLAQAETEAEKIQERFKGNKFETYNKVIADIIPISAALKNIEEELPGITQGVIKADDPRMIDRLDRGLLSVPLGLGSDLTDDQKKKLKSSFLMLRDAYVRPAAGANLTENEAKMYQEIFNDRLMDSPGGMLAAIDLVRKFTARKLQPKEATYRAILGGDDKLWDDYNAWGGLSSRSPIFGDAAAAAPAPQASSFSGPSDSGAPPRLANDAQLAVAGGDAQVADPLDVSNELTEPDLAAVLAGKTVRIPPKALDAGKQIARNLGKAAGQVTSKVKSAIGAPTVVETRDLPDGRVMEMMSDGSMRIAE